MPCGSDQSRWPCWWDLRALVPRVAFFGAVLLLGVMVGAFVTLQTHPGGPLGWGRTPLAYIVILSRLGVPRDAWPAAVTLFIMPMLALDAFVTAFFPFVFPNLPLAAAPTFGGLMLISAADAVTSAWLFRQ